MPRDRPPREEDPPLEEATARIAKMARPEPLQEELEPLPVRQQIRTPMAQLRQDAAHRALQGQDQREPPERTSYFQQEMRRRQIRDSDWEAAEARGIDPTTGRPPGDPPTLTQEEFAELSPTERLRYHLQSHPNSRGPGHVPPFPTAGPEGETEREYIQRIRHSPYAIHRRRIPAESPEQRGERRENLDPDAYLLGSDARTNLDMPGAAADDLRTQVGDLSEEELREILRRRGE